MGTSRTPISPKKYPDIHDEYHVQSVHNHVSMIFFLGCSNSISLYKLYTCCIRLQMFSQTIRYICILRTVHLPHRHLRESPLKRPRCWRRASRVFGDQWSDQWSAELEKSSDPGVPIFSRKRLRCCS